MLVRGRTIVLCIVVTEICLEYSILYETCRSLINDGHFEVFHEAYPYLYEVLLAILLILTIIFNIVLFLYGMCGHTQRKKGYVIFVFGYHFIIVVPFFLSGLYLYLTAKQPGSSELSPHTKTMFEKALDQLSFRTLTERSLTEVTDLQESFCCCGLNGPGDYGSDFQREGGWNASLEYNNLTLSCPVEKGCHHEEFEGCLTRIPQKKRHFILVTSALGLACGLAALIITPCIYASFEYDRRLARAGHIRAWRTQIDLELEHERQEDDSADEKSDKKQQYLIGQLKEQKKNFVECRTLILEPLEPKAPTDVGSSERDDGDVPNKTNAKRSPKSSRYMDSADSLSSRSPAADGTKELVGGRKTPRQNSIPKIIPRNMRGTGSSKKIRAHSSPVTQPLLEENRASPSAKQPRTDIKESSTPGQSAEKKATSPKSSSAKKKQSILIPREFDKDRSAELF